MKNEVVWLSANMFGLRVLQHFDEMWPCFVSRIITLSDDSKTKMYDGVDSEEWKKFQIPLDYVKDPTELEAILRSISPVLVVMIGWRQILSEQVLAIPRLGVVGFHPTKLPFGRGPAPIINTILRGVRESAVTMFYPTAGKDDGDIIGQHDFVVEPFDTATTIYDKVVEGGCVLTTQFLPRIIVGTAPRVPQDESKAVYFPTLTMRDNEITSEDSPEDTLRKIRALCPPYNGAFVKIGTKKLILKAEVVDE